MLPIYLKADLHLSHRVEMTSWNWPWHFTAIWKVLETSAVWAFLGLSLRRLDKSPAACPMSGGLIYRPFLSCTFHVTASRQTRQEFRGRHICDFCC